MSIREGETVFVYGNDLDGAALALKVRKPGSAIAGHEHVVRLKEKNEGGTKKLLGSQEMRSGTRR